MKKKTLRVKKTLRDEIKSASQKEVNDFIKNIRGNIKDKLDDALMSLLGLEEKYNGKAVVDHCNARHTFLEKAIEDIAKEEAKKLVKGIKLNKDNKKMFERAFKEEFDEHLRYTAKEIAKKKAEEYVNEIASKLVPKYAKDVIEKEDFIEKEKSPF